MKLLVLACFLGLVASDSLLQKAEPAIDQTVLSFFQGAVKSGTLEEALRVHDSEIALMGDDIASEMGKATREAIKQILLKVESHVDNGKGAAGEMLKKVKELREKLKDLGEEKGENSKKQLENIKKMAKKILKKIMERLGTGKRNLDDTMDQLARMKFKELADKIKEKLLSEKFIQTIRAYMKNLFGESKLVQKLKIFVESLNDKELREIIAHSLEYGYGGKNQDAALNGKTLDKVRNFFNKLNVKIKERSRKIGQWVTDMWINGLDKLRIKYGIVKNVAMEFVSNVKDKSASDTREALDFLRPHKQDLGKLWKQIIDATNEVIGRF